MASIINATTSTGLVSSADNSGSLQLATNNGTTAVTIDTSQRVGVGTTSPTGKLHVYGSGEVQTLQRSSGSANNYTLFKTESGADQAYLGFSDAGVNDFAIYNVQNGYIRFGTNNAERMRITNGGDVFIGTTTTFSYANGDLCVNANGGGDPAIVAGVNSTSAAYNNIVLGNSTGGVGRIQTNGSATAYLTSSDYRLKKDVTPIQDALGTIESLNPVAFTWNVDNRQDAGFLAHEFQEILPNYADGTKDGVDADGKPAYQAVDKSGVIPFLVKAVQELNAKVDAQAVRIAELEGAR